MALIFIFTTSEETEETKLHVDQMSLGHFRQDQMPTNHLQNCPLI